MVDVGMEATVAAVSARFAVVRILAVGVGHERAGQQHLAQARRPRQHQRVRQLAAVHGHAETAFGLLLSRCVSKSRYVHSLCQARHIDGTFLLCWLNILRALRSNSSQCPF